MIVYVRNKMSKKQVVDELHRSARKNFPRRHTLAIGINETLQADLVEMIPYAKENKNTKYILTVIDIFSKFAWAFPVKNKTGLEVTQAMTKIMKSGVVPKNIHTDMGKEFFNVHFKKLMDSYGINHYTTYSTKKAAIVERFNRTLKNKMWKRFSFNGSYKWLKILPELVDEYNNTIHRTIQMRPIDVDQSAERQLKHLVYANEIRIARPPKFKVGDHVRISKYKNLFEKGYTPNWTAEIFQVRKVRYTYPYTYLLQDYKGNEIIGGFYQHEIQKAMYPDVFLIEKVLRRKGNKEYVKWLGFDSSHNSWIDKEDVV